MSKFKINVDEIIGCTSKLIGIIGSKSSLLILDNFKLVAKDNSMKLLASDSETWLTMYASVEYDEEFDICVNAKHFCTTLAGLAGRDVTIEIDYPHNMLRGDYGKGNFKLPFVASNDFPQPTQPKDESMKVTIEGARLVNAINKTEFATGNDELRPIMNGIHFDLSDKGFVAVASDGHKLIKYLDTTIKHDGEMKGITLPSKPSRIIRALLDKNVASVEMTFDDAIVSFTNESFTLITRQQIGRYPNYDMVIPKYYTRKITIEKKELVDSLKRIMPLGNNMSHLVAIDITNKEISCEDLDYSTGAKEQIEFTDNEPNVPLKIGFNATMLLQVLSVINSEIIHVWLKEANNATLIIPKDQEDGIDFLGLVMPLILNN